MSFGFRVIGVVLVLASGLAGQTALAAQAADEEAVNSRVEELYAALNRGDVEGYAASFQEDGVAAVRAVVSVGRTNIASFVRGQFATGLRVTFTRHATRLLSPTTAIVHGTNEVTSATPSLNGHSILTLVKEGNDWLIAAYQVSLPEP